MNRAPLSHLPTADQVRLLRVILGPDEGRRERWREWREGVKLDDIDAGSFRLLPMLWHVLEPLKLTDPDLDRYRGVARKVWYETQLTFRHLGNLLEAWHETGRPIAILKGGALAPLYYPSPALRPMDDGDLLVREPEARAAIAWFTARGWQSQYGFTAERLARYTVHKMHSADLRNGEGRAVDLHWHLLNLPVPAGATADVWEAMEPFKLGAATALTLCPTDHLLHACVHGLFWNHVPAIRWIADAAFILRRAQARIDWDRLVRLTADMQVGHFVRPALAYLVREFTLNIPAPVLSRLAALPVTPWQTEEYRALTTPNVYLWRDYIANQRLARLRAVSPAWREKSAWRARCDYHKLVREIDSDWQLAGLAIRRAGSLLRAKLTG